MWLLSIAIGLVVGILFACGLAIVFVPYLIVAGAIFATNASAVWPLAVVAVILLLPIALVVGGFLAAQHSTYWTLAFRRLDLDYPPGPS